MQITALFVLLFVHYDHFMLVIIDRLNCKLGEQWIVFAIHLHCVIMFIQKYVELCEPREQLKMSDKGLEMIRVFRLVRVPNN